MLQDVPSASDPTVRQMRSLRGELDADAGSVVKAQRLAQAYIDYGRQIGDAHYAGYAEAVLAPWLLRASPPVAVSVEYATILQYRHQFAESRRELKRALEADPHNTQAWLTLATLDMVQGDYDTASRDCSQLATNGGYILDIACSGNLRSYIGQAQQSHFCSCLRRSTHKPRRCPQHSDPGYKASLQRAPNGWVTGRRPKRTIARHSRSRRKTIFFWLPTPTSFSTARAPPKC